MSTESHSDFPEVHSGSVVFVVTGENGEYTVTQVPLKNTLPLPVDGRLARKEFKWNFGPLTIIGYVDPSTFEIGVEVSILGINLGNFYGSLEKGVVVKVNLFLVKGFVRFYLKDKKKEVWVQVELDVKFDGSFKKDYKLLQL